MSQRQDLIELEGCTDCLMFIANGDFPPENTDEQNAAFDAAIGERWKGYDVVVAAFDEHFSWSACDVCGSKLGGSRYPCAAWKCD